MMYDKKIYCFIFLLLGLAVQSCTKEQPGLQGDGEPLVMELLLCDSSSDFSELRQRGPANLDTPGDPGANIISDALIEDAVVLVFNEAGALESRQSFVITPEDEVIAMQIKKGIRHIYVLGNVTDKELTLDTITTEAALRSTVLGVKDGRTGSDLEAPLLFSGAGTYTIASPVPPSTVTPRLTLPMHRMVARVDFQYNVADELLAEGVKVEKVELTGALNGSYCFPQAGGTVPSRAALEYSFIPKRSEEENGRCVFYMFENVAAAGAAVKITARKGGESKSQTLPIIKVSGDVKRNNWYKLNATIKSF